jgi:hypothetical protein
VEQQTIIVPLRDDAPAADVETLQRTLLADDRVDTCDFVCQNVAPAAQQTGVWVQTPGPEGDPLTESWLEITLVAGLTEAEGDAVLHSLETNPVFDRTVLAKDSPRHTRPAGMSEALTR